MLFGKSTAAMRGMRNNIRRVVFLLVIAMFITIPGCTASKGSIVILENPDGKGFTMDFKEWSSNDECELSLNNGDVLQFEVIREEGRIDLTVSGKKGSEPYEGKDLRSGIFTLTVSESDKYEIRITGKDAAGKVTVKCVGSSAE